MSKQKLLLSVAAAVVLAGSAYADTTISTSTSKGLVTGTTTDTDLTGNAGNVTIAAGGAIKLDTDTVAAISINSAHSVYSNGLIQNNSQSNAYGIEVDMSAFSAAVKDSNGTITTPATTPWGPSGAVFTNAAGQQVSGALIYLDSSSVIKLAGDSGTTKYGIWVNGSGSACTTCIASGDIVMATGSDIYMKGSTLYGIYVENDTVLDGSMRLGGTIETYQVTASSTSGSGMYGVYMAGKINGDFDISSTGKILAAGQGAYGVYLAGDGIGGALTIEGSVIAEGLDSSLVSGYNPDDYNSTYPEAATALSIGGTVTGGFKNSGTIRTVGTGQAIYISPSLSYGASSYDPVESLVFGNFGTTGYSFVNTGTIDISPANTNKSAGAAISIVGGGSKYATILDGGLYNSGTISAAVRNSSDTPTTVTVTGLTTSGYVYIGGYYDKTAAYNSSTGIYDTAAGYTADKVACTAGSSLPSCTYTYKDKDGEHTVDASTKGSLFNSGTISAKASGTGASTSTAIYIASTSQLTSIVNSGTILASSTVDSDHTDDVTALASYAIVDYSGTLTYIYNTGTIAAEVTTLDNDAQTNYAVYLSGNTMSRSGTGVTIVSEATASSSAKIVGDIVFGDGDKEQLYVKGYDADHTSTLIGDIYYGGSASPGATNGDILYVGSYGYVDGRVIATNDVAVEIADHGTLKLENDTTQLKASNLTIHDGGTLSIGVSEQMRDTGAIDVSGKAIIGSNATIDVSYNSFVPQGDKAYLLIRATHGNLLAGDGVTALTTNNLTAYNDTINQNIPFLFSNATLGVKTTADSAYDEVVLNVVTKTADELKLTGYAKQIFPYANAALDIDPDLGAAMINDIGAGCGKIVNGACSGTTSISKAYSQAQAAYNAFAPNLSGGTRAILLSLTDQATGVIGARQRAIRQFDKDESGMKIWAQGFAQTIKTGGQGAVGSDGSYAQNGFKDKGFGFALGADSGSSRFGWYGGALTVYNGNVEETGRDSHENQLWVLLSGYSSWRGSHMFLDTKLDAGYGRIRGKRFLTLTDTNGDSYVRESDSTHAAESLSGGVTTGAIFTASSFKFTPQISLDGMLMRMEKYSEKNPDSTTADTQAFLLTVNQGYAKSLRTFVGTSAEYDFKLFGATWQPAARVGYRYDLLSDRLKAKVAFKDIDSDLSGDQPGQLFTLYGADPARGNMLAGASFGANAGSWMFNFGLDLVKGNHGLTEQVGTFNFVARL